MVKILDDLVWNIDTTIPPKPLTTDHYPKKSFTEANPKLFYHCSCLKSLEELYRTIQQSENLEEQDDFSLSNLRIAIQNLDSEKPKTEEYVSKFVAMTTSLSFQWPEPFIDLKFKHYQICYQILQVSVDNFVQLASQCVDLLNLPMIQTQQAIESQEIEDDKPVKDKKKQSQKSAGSSTQKKNTKGKKGADTLKIQNQLKTSGTQGGRITPTVSTSTRFTTPVVPEISRTPSCEQFSPVDFSKLTKSNREKYREHMYIQVYNILNSAVLQFVSLIED